LCWYLYNFHKVVDTASPFHARNIRDDIKRDLADKIEVTTSDEFGQMATKVDGLSQTRKSSTQFARLVREGILTQNINPPLKLKP
jgi:predicted RNA-binding protein with PIN domain